MNKRNLIKQEVICKDGTKKNVFHKKAFNTPQFLSRKEFWNMLNKEPKPKSKRQQKLAELKEVEGTTLVESA